MNKKLIWMLVVILIVCGVCTLTCCNENDDTVSIEEDASQFVTLTDAVPDAILEIRY